MDTAKQISRTTLSSWSPDHVGQVTVLQSVDSLVTKAANVKLDSQIQKYSAAKARTSRSPSTSSKSRSQSASSTKQPAKRRPSLKRSNSPDTKQMLKDLKEIRANVERQRPTYSMGQHLSMEIRSGMNGIPNGVLQSSRLIREAKTNDSIARTSLAQATIEAGSKLNQ